VVSAEAESKLQIALVVHGQQSQLLLLLGVPVEGHGAPFLGELPDDVAAWARQSLRDLGVST